MGSTTTTNIVVIGAGITGLTTALTLSRSPAYSINVIAEHLPNDTHHPPSYASPWAGAHYDTGSSPGTISNDLEKATYPHLYNLATKQPESAIELQDYRLILRTKDRGQEGYEKYKKSEERHPWVKHWFMPREEVQKLGFEDVAGEIDEVICYESMCINTVKYLRWLVGECKKNGVTFKQAKVGSIEEASKWHHSGKEPDVVVNATGLGARSLGGVEDRDMYSVKGQTVIVREPSHAMYGISDNEPDGRGEDEKCYIMKRPQGGGTVLGGCFRIGDEDGEVDEALAERIVWRIKKVAPELNRDLEVMKIGVGFRPARKGGVRIERERIGEIEVVHCYGHGGSGYQQSWGSAEVVKKLVEDVIRGRDPQL